MTGLLETVESLKTWFLELNTRERLLTLVSLGGILVLIFLAVTGKLILKPAATSPADTTAPAAPAAPLKAVKTGGPVQRLSTLTAEQIKRPWGRNPFQEWDFSDSEQNFQRPSADTKEKELFLTGVMIRNNRKIAIINHSFLEEGDEIQGAKLLTIANDEVILEKNGKEIHLKMSGTG